MRGILNAPGAAARAWDRFFFTPADPTPLGLIRLATGLLLFWSLLVTGLHRPDFLGPDAWVSPEAARQNLGDYGWSLWLWVPDHAIGLTWIVGLVATAAFALGLGSRATAILAWAFAVSTARRAPTIQLGFDAIVSTWAFYLAVTGSGGQAVSLDRFFSRLSRNRAELRHRRMDRWAPTSGVPEPTISANIALRLIQLHLGLIYGMAGLAKLQGPAWWDGSAVARLLGNAEFRPFDLTGLFAYPAAIYLVNAATHATILFEVGYPVLIWLRPWRPFLLGFAVALHAGIGLTMGLYEFALAMIAGNVAFASGPWLRSLVSGRSQPRSRVLYDGACPRCRASVALLAAADPDRVVEPIDLTSVDVASVHPGLTVADCMRSMHVVRSDGRVFVGYDAVVAVARSLPLFWPVAGLGSIPGVPLVGRIAYNRVAAGRPRDEPCTDEACGLHPPKPRPAAPAGSEARRTPR